MLTALWAPPAAAQQTGIFTLNVGSVAPANTPWAKHLDAMKRRVEKTSKGRIKVKLFLGTVGGEVSIVRQTKRGELQAAAVSTGALAGLVPEMNVFELPYLFKDAAQADNMIDNHLFEPIQVLLREYGFELYFFAENGFRDFAVKGPCIQSPKDLEEVKMRTQENWVHQEMYRILGAKAVRLSVPETLPALKSGAVQGFDNTPTFAFAADWTQQIDHWTLSNHIYQPAVVVYNKEWFDKLPSDLQHVLLSDREAEANRARALVRRTRAKLLKNLERDKITICELSASQREEFELMTNSLRTMFRKRVGKKGALFLDVIENNH